MIIRGEYQCLSPNPMLNRIIPLLISLALGFGGGPQPLINDAFIPPDLNGLSAAQKTSEMMLGKVAVGVVLFESDGTIDESTEDWASEEVALVREEIEAAADWWAEREPRANLSFVFEWHLETTGYEPITHPHYEQRLWINEVMGRWGYDSSSYVTNARRYNADLLERHQADRAFTVFVVDSSNDIDNTFEDGRFAFAFRGGPCMSMTYGNDGYGPAWMDMVAAHEIGHVFHAQDQLGIPCSYRSGCADVMNRNSNVQPNCVSPVPSIMKWPPSAYLGGLVDRYARGQVGWWDYDMDDIFDCVDDYVGEPHRLFFPTIMRGAQ